ncbi:MAG: membrane protein [Euryarchaeota archaeon]|nr:membrane protein [Euryarchaeota archaeon]
MDKFHLENRDPYAYIQLITGLFVFAAGIVFMLKADLGMSPWGTFHVGVIHHLPLTLGRISQLVGLVIIVLSLFLGIYPGVGTVLNMFFIGLFIDLINPYIPFMDGYLSQACMLGMGILFVGIASGLYINANLGAGPRDSLMLGLSKKTEKSVRFIRNSIEITVLITGFFLGGPAGLGTVAFALGIGPSVQFFLKRVPKRGKS